MEANISFTTNTQKQPNLPSNYVTLAQLRQRWIKEQEGKQKEKEPQEEERNQNKAAEPEQLSQPIRRTNSKRKPGRRNSIGTNFEESEVVSAAVLEENENVKSEEMKNKKKKKKKKKKKNGEARAQEEEAREVTGSEAHALPVKSEKKKVGYERKREMQMQYREKVVEENNRKAEIEKEIGDLSIVEKGERSTRQNEVIDGRIRNREYNGYANRGDRNYRGHNDGGDRVYRQYRGGGGYGSFNGKNGRYGGGHGRFNGNGQHEGRDGGKVWVKKEEVADGGDMVGNQSSVVN